MSQVSKIFRDVEGSGLMFWCPGCKESHLIYYERGTHPVWKWNGDVNKPTITPSIKVTYRHPKGHTNENPAPVGYAGEFVEDICHSFVTDGRIQFLPDSTHALSGQIVDLPELPEWMRD